ncbi:hypothetical protein H4R33_000435 [Dimargaris cristalligena]|nr:hypothetical protein H4R33_000435 [Dimargaris cristalligena]
MQQSVSLQIRSNCIFLALLLTFSTSTTVPNYYIVNLEGTPGSTEAQTSYLGMVNKLQSLGISYTSTHNFTELINAASFYLEDQYVDAITSLPMVSAIWPMRLTSLDRTPLSANSATNQTASSLTRPPRALLEHYYTGVNFAHQAPYNLTGRDIKVGVIDSGIDYHHPAFGSCYKTPGCRIQYGYDFVGDQFNGTNVLQPDDDPLDTCNGHGTTVTGILAGYDSGTDGEETYKGVAPDAILGIYRALGCSGLTNSVALIRAIEQAYVDGMQIINISVATASGWDAWSEAKVVQEFSNRGRIVVSAAGNSGLDNMWSVSSPSIALGCISVGSAEMPRHYSYYLDIQPESSSNASHSDGQNNTVQVQRSDWQAQLPPLNLQNVALVRGLNDEGDDFACTSLPSLTDKAILVQRGTCSYNVKAKNAQAAGGVLLIIYNNEPGTMADMDLNNTITIPAVSIYQVDGLVLVQNLTTSEYSSDPPTLSVSTNPIDVAVFDNYLPNSVSWFSSWGPAAGNHLKPNLVAPGSKIYSPRPLNLGTYDLASGTSMSSPYVAGVAALLLQQMSAISVSSGDDSNYTDVFARIVHTADVIRMAQNGTALSVAQQGNGVINALRALQTAELFDQLSLNAGFRNQSLSSSSDSEWSYSVSVCHTDQSAPSTTYQIEYISALSVTAFDDDNVLLPIPFPGASQPTIGFDLENTTKGITVESGQSCTGLTFSVDISNLPSDHFWLYSGYIHVYSSTNLTNDSPFGLPNPLAGPVSSITLPLQGFSIALDDLPMFSNLPADQPQLVHPDTNDPVTPGTAFSFQNLDRPVIQLRVQIPLYRIRIRIAKPETPNHPSFTATENQLTYLKKIVDGTGGGTYKYTWNGSVYTFLNPEKVFALFDREWVLQLLFTSDGAEGAPEKYWYSPTFKTNRGITNS